MPKMQIIQHSTNTGRFVELLRQLLLDSRVLMDEELFNECTNRCIRIRPNKEWLIQEIDPRHTIKTRTKTLYRLESKHKPKTYISFNGCNSLHFLLFFHVHLCKSNQKCLSPWPWATVETVRCLKLDRLHELLISVTWMHSFVFHSTRVDVGPAQILEISNGLFSNVTYLSFIL